MIPIIGDELAHAFNGEIHISTIHAKYGSDHLEADLARTESANENTKNHNIINMQDEVSIHVFSHPFTCDFLSTEINENYPALKLSHLPVIFISLNSPPPEC